jgi:hypothetical protein
MTAQETPPPLGYMPYNFSIVGVQKSGTTTLSGTITQHRNVCKAPRKEAHFFDREHYDWANPDYERDYVAPRRSRVHTHLGDSTPSYLFWPQALPRMAAYKPDMPLVAIFRDPLERLFSHWVMLRSRNPKWPDWEGFLSEFPDTTPPERVPEGARPTRFQHMAGIGRGMYGALLQRGFESFPREQWLLIEFRDMLKRFDHHVNATTDHIGLPRFDEVPALKNRYAGAESVTGTAPTGEELARLAELYAEDVALFERLSGLDVSAWPTRRIVEGAMDPAELAAKFAQKVRPLDV